MRMKSVLSLFLLLTIFVFCCSAPSKRPSTTRTSSATRSSKGQSSTGRSSTRKSSSGRSSTGNSSSGRSEVVDLFLTGKRSGTGQKGKPREQLADLLESIRETLEKCKHYSEEIEEAKDRKKAISIFSKGQFWEQLFKKDGNSGKTGGKQLMSLKEFHRKYESTLPAEFLFLDIKKWLKTHSNWKGKGKTDVKSEKEQVKLLQYMYDEFFLPCTQDEWKIADVFGLNNDEVVLRVLDKDGKSDADLTIGFATVDISPKSGDENPTYFSYLTDTYRRKNKFTFNNYDTSSYEPEKLTLADLMNMKNLEQIELFGCKRPMAEAKKNGDRECRSYYINLRDEKNKKLVSAKKGRFVVKPVMPKDGNDRFKDDVDANVEVDTNAWAE